MKFRGKNGFVMWFTLVFVVSMSVGLLIRLWPEEDAVTFWVMLAVFVLITAFIGWFMIRNCIYVENGEIKVCLGMTTSVVDISNIVSMKKVINAIASSGTSLDRIEIIFIKGKTRKVIYVSPKDKKGFIDEVCKYNPKIAVYGDLNL